MNWELFYLICFVVGFAFCAISFLGGTHLHLPKGGAHLGGMHVGGHGAAGPCHTTVHSAGHGPGAAHASGDGHAQQHGAHFSVINPITLAAFLAWFGGTGYLILHFRPIWIFAGLVMAMLAGMAGASLVFWFVVKVLLGHERDLNPMDYEMVGVLGKVSNTIRAKGTGEMIYVQEGARR